MIEVQRGEGPIVLGLPHTGTDLPEEVAARLNEGGLAMADTDWHIHRLYDGLLDAVTTVRTPIHRYAIDVNRGPDDSSLYPGQNTTGLCPVTDFDGNPIYRTSEEPDAGEIEHRRERYHAPYHDALSAELQRVKDIHGVAVLYDCHSIRSWIPYLFDGKLPDLNIGTNTGQSCDPLVENCVDKICCSTQGYTSILNGRFKGGWTTRHYGRPFEGFHAIQMELAQSTYMTESAPWTYLPEKAGPTRAVLSEILQSLQTLALSGDLT